MINIHAEWENGTGQIEQKMWFTFAHLYLRNGYSEINEQNKSIAIGPLYLQTEFEAI